MNLVLDWADQRLAALGIARTGPIELNRARPWSTTWHFDTELGTLWLKACGRAGRYEAGLHALLADVAPEWTLQPLAADLAQGWLLLPDGGPDLRTARPDATAERWCTILAEYAEMQRRLADFVPHLLAVGVPDCRPGPAPARFRKLVDDHTDGPLRERLLDYAPAFESACRRLGHAAVPATVQHDDLHDGAVLCGVDGAGPPAFFDWGDAMVSHPFGTLLVTQRVIGLSLQPPQVRQVTGAYLEPWTDLQPSGELREQLDDVLTLAKVGRAWSWARALQDASAADWAEWDQPVSAWLEELL